MLDGRGGNRPSETECGGEVMEYGIYQIKKELIHDFGFLSFEDSERINGEGSVRLDNYDSVYEFDLESSSNVSLDDIYFVFNERRPDDFEGHSLSVSDVVRVGNDCYYCDSFGWKKLDWRDK